VEGVIAVGITKSTTCEAGWWRCGLPLFAVKRDVRVVKIVRIMGGARTKRTHVCNRKVFMICY
jgi:hypothetical protein